MEARPADQPAEDRMKFNSPNTIRAPAPPSMSDAGADAGSEPPVNPRKRKKASRAYVAPVGDLDHASPSTCLDISLIALTYPADPKLQTHPRVPQIIITKEHTLTASPDATTAMSTTNRATMASRAAACAKSTTRSAATSDRPSAGVPKKATGQRSTPIKRALPPGVPC
jgi:hypothetical protein